MMRIEAEIETTPLLYWCKLHYFIPFFAMFMRGETLFQFTESLSELALL